MRGILQQSVSDTQETNELKLYKVNYGLSYFSIYLLDSLVDAEGASIVNLLIIKVLMGDMRPDKRNP